MAKRRDDVDFHVRLPIELHAALEVLVRHEDRTLAGLIRQLARDELARRGMAPTASRDRERERRVASLR